MAQNSDELEHKKNYLLSIQAKSQELWNAQAITQVDASDDNPNKYMVTFPFPYVNGCLHFGHAFTISKGEIAVRFQSMCGKQVLFPFAFHASGMPIVSSAHKLNNEITTYGNPPVFPIVVEKASESPHEQEEYKELTRTKYKSKKSKAKAKDEEYQYNALRKMDVKVEEIPNFTDPHHWVRYFPEKIKEDLRVFGAHIDWRRSFVTTELNPYYDSFVRWQFTRLKEQGKVVFGKRYTIWSPLFKQACMDHERSVGESVGPLEYVLVKMRVMDIPAESPLTPIVAKYPVFMVSATVRPETLYGQTNIWVSPTITYGAFLVNNSSEVFICTDLSHQEFNDEMGVPQQIATISGSDLIGVRCHSPLSTRDTIIALPMPTILETRGTGIVVSVPSDAPDSYIMLSMLRNKPNVREIYGVREEWVTDLEPVPIINVIGLGDCSARAACEKQGVQSINDITKLEEAKKEVFEQSERGIMLVGPHAGSEIREVIGLIETELTASGQVVRYFEPESKVVSRGGDECVVALADQWYIPYDNAEWRAAVLASLLDIETYGSDTRDQLKSAIEWLKGWACSRSFGLGTRLPWASDLLIESLSDSTIYMAYYTVAHLLQGGAIEGDKIGPLGIRPEQITNEVWDHVFCRAPVPTDCTIPQEALAQLRKEYEYWYPFDLRFTGKDLIANHLTFCLYNHVALLPKDKLPKSFRANGHIMLDDVKMSKSNGNFQTLQEGMKKYTSDGARLILADAGDGLGDANFKAESAFAAIHKLYNFVKWVEEFLADTSSQLRYGEYTFSDTVFDNSMNTHSRNAYNAYQQMKYHVAVQAAFYSMLVERDVYRRACELSKVPMHATLIHKFIERTALLVAPIAPHTCEHIWRLLGHTTSIMKATFPSTDPVNEVLSHQNEVLEEAKTLIKQRVKSKKGDIRIVLNVNSCTWLRGFLEMVQQLKEVPEDKKALLQLFADSFPSVATQDLMHVYAAYEDEVKNGKSFMAKVSYNIPDFLRSQTEMLIQRTGVRSITVEERETNKIPGFSVSFTVV